MKPSEEKKDTLFDLAKSINEVSQRGSLYGRLGELKAVSYTHLTLPTILRV